MRAPSVRSFQATTTERGRGQQMRGHTQHTPPHLGSDTTLNRGNRRRVDRGVSEWGVHTASISLQQPPHASHRFSRLGEKWLGRRTGIGEAHRGLRHETATQPINRVKAGGVGWRNRQYWQVVLRNGDDLTRSASDTTRGSTESPSGTARAVRSGADGTGG